MKSIISSILIILNFTSEYLMAQPLPPTTPQGNPVPVGFAAGFLLLGGLYLAIRKRKK